MKTNTLRTVVLATSLLGSQATAGPVYVYAAQAPSTSFSKTTVSPRSGQSSSTRHG